MDRALLSDTETCDLRPALQKSPLFTDLTPDQLSTVLAHTRVIELPEGRVLFRQRQRADEFFMLDTGQIKLARMSADGHEKIIDLISPGNTFAEAIVFSGQPAYPVTASAIMHSRILCFDSKVYTGILHQSTDACFAILAQMSRRLHWYIGELDRLTLHGAAFRVVCYLLDQVPSTHLGSSEIKLSTPKHVIASRLSVTPETLSRSLSRLRRDGLIEVNDESITLNDVGKLRHFAQGESV